jgi:hypothetical protein|tara:strand:+ start:5783 stop:6325 length:543 start_codon:yes stop_codon:yes gene_type:complete
MNKENEMDLSVFDGGSGNTYLSYKAQGEPHWKCDGESVEITQMLFDPSTLKTGWGKLALGEAPNWVWSEQAGTTTPKPSDDHKPAFSINCHVQEENGSTVTGWREWNTTGAGARHAMKSIWTQIDAGAKSNSGKCAVIDITGYEGKKFGPATVTIPIFKLAGWVETPGELAPAVASENVF